ncbi:MAG: beta-lactamase family protein [Candidatus Eremiobacteraeota bacterium]|nr:beta-lactamase family protein [Candidatus Eremiobacteraeota bacterium]
MTGTVAVSDVVLTAMRAQRVPGSEIAIAEGNTLSLNRGYGLASIKANSTVTSATQFEIGSITKQITAAAILQLKEQGKFKLSDRLGKFLPRYVPGRNVTLEQMLWHISGIPDFMFVHGFPTFWCLMLRNSGGFNSALALIKNEPLQFNPGTRYAYSNSNYVLLGEVISRVTHMSWRDYVRKNILSRAGMTQTSFIDKEPALPNMAVGYREDPKGVVIPAPPFGYWPGAGGSIVSTAADIARWDQAFFAGKIVNQDDVKLATTAHILPSGESTGEGFGWEVGTYEGQPRFAYTVSTNGFTAENEYFPKTGEAIIVLTNSVDEQVRLIANAVFAVLHPALAQETPAPGEDPKVTALLEQWITASRPVTSMFLS